MFVVGLANYIGLRLLGIPFALPLAILAGLLEIVPYIGPILAAVPAVLIGLGISPIIGVAAASLAFLIQQLENYLFVPKIMQKSAGVNPIVTLFSLAVGLEVAGIVGLLISVPVYITVKVLAGEYLLKNK
jgi:predicted PurR-regulated permease PerM